MDTPGIAPGFFISECIRPRLELIEGAFAAHLLPAYGPGLLLKHDNLVPSDRAQVPNETMTQLDRGVDHQRSARRPGATNPSQGQGEGPGANNSSVDWNASALDLARRHYSALEGRFAG